MPALSRSKSWLIRLSLLGLLAGCTRGEPDAGAQPSAAASPSSAAAGSVDKAPAGGAQSAEAATPPLRKLVKKASLDLEVSSPSAALAQATRIAEREGGFVANTERSANHAESEPSQAAVTLTLRVPAERFSATLDALRRLGQGAGSERVTTDDVSEEFIDLEARIRNQRELETQFIEILKRAGKVKEALNVQRELATVRTDIDRMEGRRRFLERETALSTITLGLTAKQPLVSAGFGEFGYAVTHAISDAVNLGAGIVTGGIRLLGVLLPLALFLGLPSALALRALSRRRRASAAAL